MWKGPNEDPGPPPGGSDSSPEGKSNPQLTDLRDENEQQQLLIAQLKEIIRKNEQSSVTAEKVDEFANTLAKAKRNKLKRETASAEGKPLPQDGGKKSEGLQNQKVLLMKQQLEENKAILAARGKNQKGIDDMVVQIKAQLGDSQHLISQSTNTLNLSLLDTSKREQLTASSSDELLHTLQNKEKNIQTLSSKVQTLEAQILDLQENLKEKDSVIDARTKAITLMSENLSKKGKTTLDALDDTKEEMRNMQSSFVETEEKLRSDKQKLLQQIYEKDEQIANLKDANEELDQINKSLTKLNDGLQERLTTRSEKPNEDYENTISNLNEKIRELEEGNKSSPSKSARRNRKSSKQRTYEPNQNTEMEAKITFQQSIIADKQFEIDTQEEKISELEALIQKLKANIIKVQGGKESVSLEAISETDKDSYETQIAELKSIVETVKAESKNTYISAENEALELSHQNKITELQSIIDGLKLQVDTIEPLQTKLDDFRSRVKVLQLEKQALQFSDTNTSVADSEELMKLKKQLDDNNKNMIKSRAQHKSQLKDLQKKLDVFKKANNEESDLEKLHGENSKLLLKVAELEDDIGNMQLKMVESTDSNVDSATNPNNLESDLAEKNKKNEELQNDLVQLRSQIDGLNVQLESLSKFENAKVSSDLNSIQLEEQLEEIEREKSKLIEEKISFISNQADLQDKLESIEKEKKELEAKVQSLVQENMDILDRLEKLSAEKVSSAESIEIVEGLTNQEKLEIEAYQKNMADSQKSEDNLSDGNPELNESVNQLTEETTELLQKIELFTEERREVMEKLEQLAFENNQLSHKIKEIEVERDTLVVAYEQLQNDKENHDKNMAEVLKNQESFNQNMQVYEMENKSLKSEIQSKVEEITKVTEINTKLNNDLKLHQQDLKEKYSDIVNLNQEIQNLQQHLQDVEKKYRVACQEIDEFSEEKIEYLEDIDDLKNRLSDKDENYHKIVQDLKEKCLSLQEELQQKSVNVIDEEPLKTRIAELEAKNKELRDKMKIFAANLKKKSSAFEDLTKNNELSKEKWETESREKDSQIESLNVQLQEVKDLLSKHCPIEELEIVRNNLHQMNVTNSEMQHQLSDLLNLKIEHEEQIHLLTQENEFIHSNANNNFNIEISTKDEIITRLEQEVDQLRNSSEINMQLKNTLEFKVKELELFIESQDQELTQHKVRVEKLEEGLAIVEERRSSLERRAMELGTKLEERELNYEEIIQNEDQLETRLRLLAKHDAAIEKELSATAEENQSLTTQNNQLFNENTELKTRVDATSSKLTQANSRIEQLANLEMVNEELSQNTKRLEIELTKIEKDFQNLLQKQKSENEQEQVELDDQIKLFNEERKSLTEKCEIYEERLKEYQEIIEGINNALAESNNKLQDQEQEVWRFNNQVESLQRHIYDLENKCQMFENDIGTKTAEIDNLKRDLNDNESQITELKNKLQDTNAELDENLSQLAFAKNMINQIEESSSNVLGRNCELEKKVQEIENDNCKQHAKPAFAQEKLSDPLHTSALFGSPVDDPFSFGPPQTPFVQPPTRTAEIFQASNETDLLNKIRTLEFMLYNLEQEKNDLVNQCHKMSEEITRLVYEKKAANVDLSDVASQIVPDGEAQISKVDNKQIMKNLFAASTSTAECSNDPGVPVVEQIIQTKSAYLCYDEEQPTQREAGVFGENDDGWGFIVDEPRPVVEQVQEPHRQSRSNQALLDQIRNLELEREKHLEDIRQAQVKAGKLIRKLKEFKAKNDELSAKINKRDDGFGDLESAIQDELKSQVETLEKKVKDVQYELDKEKKEKSSLFTKVNVLTSANERMVEMKEKQDVEMLGWQQRNRELSNKLEQFEWGSDEKESVQISVATVTTTTAIDSNAFQKQIDELSNTVKELSLDNEELQTLLEEQRGLRLSADRQKSVEFQAEDIKATSEYVALLSERNAMQLELNNLAQTHDKCNKEKLEFSSAVEDYKKSIKQLQDDILQLRQAAQNQLSNNESIINMQENFMKEKQRHSDMEVEMTEIITNLSKDNEGLVKSLEQTKSDILNLNETIKMINAEKLDLQQKLLENSSNPISDEIVALRDSIREKQMLIDDYEIRLKNNEVEFQQKLGAAFEEITQEWTARVDQRGSDIAESWKLHLESKENEFMHLEQQLRKEINELDQKCIGLVNENNELRKNVDAEIRDEIDRISALEQQINDKQHCINELRKVIEEKQVELNQLHIQLLENETTILNLNAILQEKDVKLVDFEKEIETRQLDADDKQTNINELNKQIDLNEVGDNRKDLEIQENMVVINDLRQEIITQQQLNDRLSASVTELNNQIAQQSKELLEERSEKNSLSKSLDEFNSNQDADSDTLIKLNQDIAIYQQQIVLYQNEIKDNQATITNISEQINNQNYSQEIALKDATINQLQHLITEKDQELEYLMENQQIANSNSQDITIKDETISQLNKTILEKDEELSYLTQNQEFESNQIMTQYSQEIETLKRSLLEYETKHEDMLQAKDNDLQGLNAQLFAAQNKFDYDNQLIQQKEMAIHELLQKDQEHEALHSDENRQLEEMRQLIEDQVLKIESLKAELYQKSTSYDALFAQVEMPQSDIEQPTEEQPPTKVEKRVHFSTPSIEEDPSEPVSRAELDLSLYMLHQRDVRCEELTVELMQLLEERDTLQLRLSNAIREKEVFRGQQKQSTEEVIEGATSEVKSGAVPKTRAILLGATNTEMASEALETDIRVKSLNNKLSELKSVGYRRDKTLVDEQDYRRMQQMSIMNQHFEDAARLPAEAAARLVDANYTLSRDVQSPSKVLLDWLWGRSTPKVNNI